MVKTNTLLVVGAVVIGGLFLTGSLGGNANAGLPGIFGGGGRSTPTNQGNQLPAIFQQGANAPVNGGGTGGTSLLDNSFDEDIGVAPRVFNPNDVGGGFTRLTQSQIGQQLRDTAAHPVGTLGRPVNNPSFTGFNPNLSLSGTSPLRPSTTVSSGNVTVTTPGNTFRSFNPNTAFR